MSISDCGHRFDATELPRVYVTRAAPPAALLRKVSQRPSVSLPSLRGDRESVVHIRVVGAQQAPVRRLDREHFISGLEVEALRHVAWQRGPDGPAHAPQFHASNHELSM